MPGLNERKDVRVDVPDDPHPPHRYWPPESSSITTLDTAPGDTLTVA
jgi:hypothetical protein